MGNPLYNAPLYEMTNITGRVIRTDEVNFSFFFSSKQIMPHNIRVKVVWNRNKISGLDSHNSGDMWLHGELYRYRGCRVSAQELNKAREFFRRHKVLFAAVWECALDEYFVERYLRGDIEFIDLVRAFNFHAVQLDRLSQEFVSLRKSELYGDRPDDERNLLILENIVRRRRLFNMND